MSVATLSETRVFNRDLEAVRENVLGGIIEAAIDGQPVLWLFAGRGANDRWTEQGSRGMGKRTLPGGESIVTKVRLGKNDTAKALTGGYDTYDLTPQDNVRHARWNWKQYGAGISIDEHLIDTMGGGLAFYDVVEAEMADAANSLADLMASHLYNNGGSSNNVNDLNSLISANDAIGGLSGATYSNWNSRGISARGTAAGSITFTPTTTSFAAAGLDNWRTAYDNASEGGTMTPNAILTTYLLKQAYEAKIQSQERYQPIQRTDARHMFLNFGMAPVIPDPKCPTGDTYFVNTETLHVVFLAGADFNSTPFQQPDRQRVRVSKVFATCEAICRDRKSNNRLTGQTA